MSKDKTSFEILPNEIICCVFDFLTSLNITKSFVQLNNRFKSIVQSYVKKIDLTDDWQKHQIELKQICKFIEIIKIDRLNINLLINNQFPQLHSLTLIHVSNLSKILTNLNLRNLDIWFADDDNIRCYYLNRSSFQTFQSLTRLFSNGLFNPQCYHENLIELNISIYKIREIFEILQRTPNIEYLSIELKYNNNQYCQENENDLNHFKSIIKTFHRLTKLNSLIISNQNENIYHSNRLFPLKEIQLFIDYCCPNNIILKKFHLQLDHILFNINTWSIILNYKRIFSICNIYISFRIYNDIEQIKNIILLNNQFTFHIEEFVLIDNYSNNKILHVYSLPFVFNKLYGFTCCSQLNQQCSYSTVRHLYCSINSKNPNISFQLLNKRMPHLNSIYYEVGSYHNCVDKTFEIINDDDLLSNIHTLYFCLTCRNIDCTHYIQLSRLVSRMPNLKYLTTLNDMFVQIKYSMISIKKLHLFAFYHSSIGINILQENVPNLSILIINNVIHPEKTLISSISNLFMTLSHLFIISSQIYWPFFNHREPLITTAERILTTIQKIDKKFHYLEVRVNNLTIDFSISQ